MKRAITRLAFHCPDDLTDKQWVYCIHWTWNLHGNCGVIPDYIPTNDLQRIVEEFETKIDAGPNLATIDWLWDEYDRSSSIGYERFRPTSAENWAQLETWYYRDELSWWQSEYERMAAEK